MRRVIAARVHRQLRMHAGHHDVEALQQLGFLVEAAVVEDVDLDPGENAHAARTCRATHRSRRAACATAPARARWRSSAAANGRSARNTRDPAPRRWPSSPRSAPTRPTSWSAGADPRAARRAPRRHRDRSAAERNSTRSIGLTAGPGLGDDLGGFGPDARQRLPAVGLTVPFPRGVVEALDDVGGVAVGHHASAGPGGSGPCSRRSAAARSPDPWLQCAWPVETAARRRIRRESPRSRRSRRTMSRAIATSVPRSGFSNWLTVSRRAPWLI